MEMMQTDKSNKTEKLIYQIFFLSLLLRLFTITANGFELSVRAGFGAHSFNLLLNFNRNTKLQVCTSARHCAKPMCLLHNYNLVKKSYLIICKDAKDLHLNYSIRRVWIV